MHSFWEKQSFFEYDVIIVGAGITGLSTAISIKDRRPQTSVLVLERGLLPSGASTKNAGFACFGSISELKDDIDALGKEGMVELVKKRWEGLLITRKRLGDGAIDLQIKGGYELIFDKKNHAADIEEINEYLNEYFGKTVFEDYSDQIDKMGFGKTKALVKNNFEGQLDTGKLIKSLWQLAQAKGVMITTGAEVTHIEKHKTIVADRFEFKSHATALCTNGFTGKFFDLDLSPGRGVVLHVIPDRPINFEGTFHYEAGYYYFRDYYGSVIFGGGRNIDKETETTTDFGVNEKIRKKLIQDLDQIILGDSNYRINMEWSGIMGFGENKSPVIKEVADGIFAGVRLGGMGVALGSKVGDELSSVILSSAF